MAVAALLRGRRGMPAGIAELGKFFAQAAQGRAERVPGNADLDDALRFGISFSISSIAAMTPKRR